MSKILTDTRDVIMKSSIGDAIRDMMSSQVVEKIKAAGTKVSEAFAGVLGGVDLGGKLQGAFDFITKSVAPQILERIGHLIEHIVSLAMPLGQSLMTLFGHLWSVVEKIATGIADAFGGAFSDASDSLSGKMLPAAELMDRVFAAIERKRTCRKNNRIFVMSMLYFPTVIFDENHLFTWFIQRHANDLLGIHQRLPVLYLHI